MLLSSFLRKEFLWTVLHKALQAIHRFKILSAEYVFKNPQSHAFQNAISNWNAYMEPHSGSIESRFSSEMQVEKSSDLGVFTS